MRPVSDNALYEHLDSFTDEIDFSFFDKGWITSATYSAFELLRFESNPKAYWSTFIDDF